MTAKTNYREQGSGVRVYLIVKPDIVAPLLNLTDTVDNLVAFLSVTGYPPHVAYSTPGRRRGEMRRVISQIIKRQRHAA